VVALAILAGGGYLVKGCLDRRCQKIVNKSADEPASAGEGEQIKETPGETGG
jgi:hypothetical protein